MAKQTRNFVSGRMNKSIDERLLPAGEYIDAVNIRVGSTELTDIGAIENSKGNSAITSLSYNGVDLSDQATCIGTHADSEQETIYWFVHDPANPQAAPPSGGVLGKVDMIVSYDMTAQQLTYHVVSETLLNFNPAYLVNGVDKIDDLLFFTDNYNEPRKINVTREYPFPAIGLIYPFRDQIIELDISVIKPPPLEAPTIEFAQVAGGENYIEDTFLCFAYRYQYADGEYSALSQFTAPSFNPHTSFKLGVDDVLNDGMQNSFNQVNITYNTGVEQVMGVDLVFKEADSNNIFVVDEYDVESQIDNDNIVSFTNGEIYTVLRSDEILRLYDNVPLKSKAQNIFGNRLLYGNYVEQRDLTDSTGQDIDLSYRVEGVSSNNLGSITLPSVLGDRVISVDSSLVSQVNILNGRVVFDLSGIDVTTDLKEGNIFQFALAFVGNSFSFAGAHPSTQAASAFNLSAPWTLNLTYTLQQDYDNLADVFDTYSPTGGQPSPFQLVSGWDGYYQTNPDNWSTGSSWFDRFNASVTAVNNSGQEPSITFSVEPCMATQIQGSLTPEDQQPIYNVSPPQSTLGGGSAEDYWGGLIIVLDGTNLEISPPAHRYKNITDFDPPYCNTGAAQLFQYFSFNTAFGYFGKVKSKRSLHSNREYQVGIIYQDSNARQTTVLVSENNSEHIDARNSISLNHLQVTIPTGMRPPSWADRYKFMLKPSQGLYETIYSRIAFSDIETGSVWILLEGEQTNKVTEGLRLIVKADSNGPLNNVVNATILEVASQAKNFLEPSTPPTTTTLQPAGVYARVIPVGWSADSVDYLLFDSTNLKTLVKVEPNVGIFVASIFTLGIPVGGGNDEGDAVPAMMINVCLNSGTEAVPNPVPLAIQSGDIISLRFRFVRNHANEDGSPCGGVESLYEETYTAQNSYPDFKDFWDAEGVNVSGDSVTDLAEIPDSDSPSDTVYNPALGGNVHIPTPVPFSTFNGLNASIIPADIGTNQYQFSKITTSDYTGDDWLILNITGGVTACMGEGQPRSSKIFAQITVNSGQDILVFETIPNKVADGIYYEGADNYPITNGFHMANPAEVDGDVNQTASVEGKVNLSFFNCFAFGNGVESYKILDSLTGNYFTLGNRSAGVTTQDYEQIRRESSITYSGLYQEQTALNNLNNFNLGLANYKDCEESYGPIEILHSFRDNLLVLQEDKISYITVNKSIITSADGTSTVTAAPTILGTQIARIEEYGISNNPESFATYGRDMFFTDAKRSSVIKLSGSVSQGDALQVISSIGMRSWFRDLFQDSFTTQKLGGFDPYMNEYVLASNTTSLPLQIPITGCRSRAAESYLANIQWLGLTAQTQYIVNGGNGVGTMQFTFTQTENTEYTITYNGVDTGPTLGLAGINLIMTVSKDVASISDLLVTVDPQAFNLSSITTMFPACPTGSEIKVVMVCLTDSQDANQTVINQHNYATGTFTSPLVQETVTFNSGSTSPIVSQFNETTGISGTAGFPASTSTVTMGANRTGSTSSHFQFNSSLNEFAYKFGNSLGYTNTPAGIAAMLAASTSVVIDGTQAPDLYTGDFPVSGTWNELYLIYDYRRAGSAMFCHSTSIDPLQSNDVCCDCTAIIGCTPFLGSIERPLAAQACPLATATTWYHNGSGIAPSVGDTIYSMADCVTAPVWGADNYIRLGDGSNEYIRLNSSGLVIVKTTC
tara:strand:- start:3036 stop:8099 length:5064 start_codon:yes stop_codon:yes gene_type:complete